MLRFSVLLLTFLLACGPSGSSPSSQNDNAVEAPRAASEAVPASATPEAPAERVERLTGAHTRVVWIQDFGNGTDIGGQRRRLRLMGYDSRDGQGERPILEELSNYTKPLFTPRGDRVVFSNVREGTVYVVNWDGTGLQTLGPGFALDTWSNPDTEAEWVYVGSDGNDEDGTFGRVMRHRIDRWENSELVWDKMRVSADTFQVSADGRFAGGLFPWPDAGVAELPNGAFHRLGTGCWTALSNSRDPLLWVFDGAHRNLTMVNVDRRSARWTLRINDAPGVEGYEVYHPRWSNNPQFLTMTGPYTVGTEDNKIRGGGTQVEIYLGRFARDFTDVERWLQVSHNHRADFYPDAWIDPRERPPDAVPSSPGPRETRPSDAGEQRLVVEARLAESAPIPQPESIRPYRRALLANEYEIVKVLEGSYDGKRLLAAHWVIRDGKVLDTALRQEGSVRRMTLEPYDQHKELEGERLVMDSDAFDLRLYYDIDS